MPDAGLQVELAELDPGLVIPRLDLEHGLKYCLQQLMETGRLPLADGGSVQSV